MMCERLMTTQSTKFGHAILFTYISKRYYNRRMIFFEQMYWFGYIINRLHDLSVLPVFKCVHIHMRRESKHRKEKHYKDHEKERKLNQNQSKAVNGSIQTDKNMVSGFNL